MESNIEIRKVAIEDVSTLAHIQISAWKDTFSDILSEDDMERLTDTDFVEQKYTRLINEKIGQGYILSIDKKPHCLAFWNRSDVGGMEDHGEINCIYSLKGNRGKGYGSMMINFIINEIKESGFEKVMLWVFEKNYGARKFYEDRNFILTDKAKVFCNAIEVVYRKDL